MKKSVLALSITAAIVGFAGGAQAMTGALGGAGATTTLALNQDGIGQMLLVPYYSAQAENNTLLTLVNTDTLRGKAVKVRFRGAANSDDVFDFQVFLSPGDVWTAAIAKGADGRAQLTTSDATCTKPSAAVLNATPFVTDRLDPTLDAAGKANGTREGYVEIFNMGDIPKGIVVGGVVVADALAATTAGFSTDATVAVNPLYTAIKHVAKVAPCSGAAWTNLDTTNLQWDTVVAAATTPRSAGLLPPTTGLMANWTIINTVGAAAWSGKAEAIVAGTAAAPAAGNVVYWPQTGTTIDPTAYTADPLLRKGVGAQVYGHNATTDTYTAEVTTAAVNAGNYDLPDMSTPYTAAADVAPGTAPTPFVQARNLTAAIAASSATNEFLTENGAKTDWVFSQPTRRYSTSLNYAAISATDDGRRFSNLFAVTALGDAATDIGVNAKTDFTTKSYFAGDTTLVTSRQICVKGPGISVWDREETTLTASTDVVVSPSTPAAALSFCGEDTVLSVNNGGIQAAGTGALKATVAVKDLDVTYIDGWMTLTTPGAHGVVGLPVLGSAFEKANAGTSSFGVAYPHRFAR